MALKPWYKVVTPREDLRDGKPLDAAEFAVHLDQVRDGRAPSVYQKPEQFFDRTYLTTNLLGLAAEVVRRLSGIKTETSAVFNMATQFGGGKTHALTLLYHLAKNGPKASRWTGVSRIVEKAGIKAIPEAATAVFVGTEFDSITGRGGSDGTPLRKTPWGEIAFQLGGEQALARVAEHEKQMVAPAGDVIRRILPNDKPCVILIDELMNYVSRSRKSGMAAQLYDFLQNLSETARSEDNVVLVVSVPASETEMNAEDHADYVRLKHMLGRLGKAVVMAAEEETSEIIRRRLFEWGGMPDEARKTAAEYADWVIDHKQQVPSWFSPDRARETFEATYPFHPTVLSVFERKWQALPCFQRTRGVLRLLALWVSKAYQDGFKGAHKDPLIGIGTAPLDDPLFRAAVFGQLGGETLEGAVTTDICGKKDANALRLDEEAIDAIKKTRLHRKVATTIFFESNGGQTRAEATMPEIRLAVAEPDLDIGNVETVLDALGTTCFFLSVERNRYRFSLSPNLNKILADRRASIKPPKIAEAVRAEVQKVFAGGKGLEVVPFPEKSGQVPDRPVLSLAVLAPDHSMQDKGTVPFVEQIIRESGTSARTSKNALIFAIAEDEAPLGEEAVKALAWEDIQDEADDLRLDDAQKRRLAENLKKAKRDLTECVWRTYKFLGFLGKDNQVRVVDLGLVHSSAAESMVALITERLRQQGDAEPYLGPKYLVKNWPPAFVEWSTRAVRETIYASPQFPKLLVPDSIKETIARGVASNLIAYVGSKGADGRYNPFHFGPGSPLTAMEVEISDDMFIITAEEAKKNIEPPKLTTLAVFPQNLQVEPGKRQTFQVKATDQHGREIPIGEVVWTATGGEIDPAGVFAAGQDEGSFLVTAKVGDIAGAASVTIAKPGTPVTIQKPTPTLPGKLSWAGTVPSQKWMNFYTKVLAKFATEKTLRLTVSFEVTPDAASAEQKAEDTKTALRELGLNDDVQKA